MYTEYANVKVNINVINTVILLGHDFMLDENVNTDRNKIKHHTDVLLYTVR